MKNLNDCELERALALCVRQERSTVAEVLGYLREVEARQLYLARGYSSLFAYCTGKLEYSEPEAYLRIQAMRLMRAVPEVEARPHPALCCRRSPHIRESPPPLRRP